MMFSLIFDEERVLFGFGGAGEFLDKGFEVGGYLLVLDLKVWVVDR